MRRPTAILLLAAFAGVFAQGGKLDYKLKPGAIPFELNANKIYLKAKVDGKDANIVLDSGSPITFLDSDYAKRNGIKMNMIGYAGGGGPKQTPYFMGHVDKYEVGGLEVHNLSMGGMALDHIVGIYEGRAMDGVIGLDVLKNFVVEIDYPNRTLRLYEAADYKAPTDVTSVPYAVEGGHIHVDGSVEAGGKSYPGKLVIDTGARPALLLNTPFIKEHNLTQVVGPTLATIVGTGIGGEFRGVVGRLDSLHLGDLVVNAPPANMPTGEAGFFEGTDALGTVGAAVFKQYVLTIDFPNKRLLFKKTRATGERIQYDMSGIFLVTTYEDRHKLTVNFVAQNTPAAAAGLQSGDVLTEVNGKKSMSAEDFRNLMLKPGSLKLKIDRGGQTIEKELTLKPLV